MVVAMISYLCVHSLIPFEFADQMLLRELVLAVSVRSIILFMS